MEQFKQKHKKETCSSCTWLTTWCTHDLKGELGSGEENSNHESRLSGHTSKRENSENRLAQDYKAHGNTAQKVTG